MHFDTSSYEDFYKTRETLKSFVRENFHSLLEEVKEYKATGNNPTRGSKLMEGIEIIQEIEPVYGLADVISEVFEVKLERFLNSNS